MKSKRRIGGSSDANATASAGSDAYEVRCYRCDVSFPIGTKRCIHCGERTGVPPVFARELTGDSLTDFGQPDEYSTSSHGPVRPIDMADEDETEPRGGSIFRMLGNMSWILLFVAITVYRQCSS